MAKRWTFEALPDVFHDLTGIESQTGLKVSTQPSLALISRSYPSDDETTRDSSDWARFAAYVKYLNKQADDNVSYKLLYLTRHGLGYHNLKHVELGDDDWNVCP